MHGEAAAQHLRTRVGEPPAEIGGRSPDVVTEALEIEPGGNAAAEGVIEGAAKHLDRFVGILEERREDAQRGRLKIVLVVRECGFPAHAQFFRGPEGEVVGVLHPPRRYGVVEGAALRLQPLGRTDPEVHALFLTEISAVVVLFQGREPDPEEGAVFPNIFVGDAAAGYVVAPPVVEIGLHREAAVHGKADATLDVRFQGNAVHLLRCYTLEYVKPAQVYLAVPGGAPEVEVGVLQVALGSSGETLIPQIHPSPAAGEKGDVLFLEIFCVEIEVLEEGDVVVARCRLPEPQVRPGGAVDFGGEEACRVN